MATFLIYTGFIFLFFAFLAFIAELWGWHLDVSQVKRERLEFRRQWQEERTLDERAPFMPADFHLWKTFNRGGWGWERLGGTPAPPAAPAGDQDPDGF